jgi:hypothetical protein
MNLKFNKSEFLNNLLTPASKLSENLLLEFAVNEQGEQVAKTIINSPDNSVILLGTVKCQAEETFRCVIPDCKTFLRLFAGIDSDTINLKINSNVILYKEGSFSFKYHLLDESYVVNKRSVSEEKLNKLTFDTTFVITKSKFSELIKFNSIIPDAEKIYFFTENKQVLVKLGDEQKTNTNEIVTPISPMYEGLPLTGSFPINILNLLLFTFSSEEISIEINHQLKVFKFSTPNLSYIVSGLVR